MQEELRPDCQGLAQEKIVMKNCLFDRAQEALYGLSAMKRGLSKCRW